MSMHRISLQVNQLNNIALDMRLCIDYNTLDALFVLHYVTHRKRYVWCSLRVYTRLQDVVQFLISNHKNAYESRKLFILLPITSGNHFLEVAFDEAALTNILNHVRLTSALFYVSMEIFIRIRSPKNMHESARLIYENR